MAVSPCPQQTLADPFPLLCHYWVLYLFLSNEQYWKKILRVTGTPGMIGFTVNEV